MGLFSQREAARARFYEDLAISLDAGLPIRKALQNLADLGGPLGGAARRIEGVIGDGRPMAEGMAECRGTFSVLEESAVNAGERSGRLPETLRRLVRHFELVGASRDRVGYGLVYPLFLVHFACLVPPLKHLVIDASVSLYLRAALPPLLVVYGLLFGGYLLLHLGGSAGPLRTTLDRVLHALPVIGPAVRATGLLDFVSTFSALYASGIQIHETLATAVRATRNTVVAEAGARAAARVKEGLPLREAFAPERDALTPLVTDAIRTGDETGHLDETLTRVERTLGEEVERRMKSITAVIPVVAYLLVVAFIVKIIFSFYAGIGQQYQDALK